LALKDFSPSDSLLNPDTTYFGKETLMEHQEFDIEHLNEEQMSQMEAEIASEKSKLARMSREDDLYYETVH
jgi:hypothetical protein